MLRNDIWLEAELDDIWKRYFPEIQKINRVVIRFGRKARTRLGSIKKCPDGSSLIQINGLLKDSEVPAFVIRATVAHELTHYAHGFSSPHEKKYDHPHRGGVVGREMAGRGLEDVSVLQKRWVKENWRDFLLKKYPPTSRKVKRRKRRTIFFFR